MAHFRLARTGPPIAKGVSLILVSPMSLQPNAVGQSLSSDLAGRCTRCLRPTHRRRTALRARLALEPKHADRNAGRLGIYADGMQELDDPGGVRRGGHGAAR